MASLHVPRPRALFASCAAFAFALVIAGGAWGYHTRFVANNCNTNPPQYSSTFTRDGSITVALYARYEGYQWGGGRFYKSSYQPRDGVREVAFSRAEL